MSTKIFIVFHKPCDYGYWDDNKLYVPIQVGRAEQFLPVRDNEGENITEWNNLYAEMTAHYNVLKNRIDGLKYIGMCQYRRRLQFPEDFDFDEIFKKCYAIVPTPLYDENTVAENYGFSHCKKDIDEFGQIVKQLYPQYADEWDKIIVNGNFMLYSNSFVMRVEDFKEYEEFFFNVTDTWLKNHNIEKPSDITAYVAAQILNDERRQTRGLKYQSQIFGFMGERLLTFWMFKDNKSLYFMNYTKFEGV